MAQSVAQQLRNVITSTLPRQVVEVYRLLRLSMRRSRNRRMTLEEVFTDIYEKNTWGGAKGEYYSGPGTEESSVADAYVSLITKEIERHKLIGLTFVDLGCGDFRISRRLLPLCATYIGVDVVQGLVDRNQKLYGNDTVRFVHADLTASDPPDGDVCFVRQVLQHLSNEEIVKFLAKLKRYRVVYITEHYPNDVDVAQVNIDKPHGGDIRLLDRSGVYLTEPPFNLPEQEVTCLLTVDGDSVSGGIIRIFQYTPRSLA